MQTKTLYTLLMVVTAFILFSTSCKKDAPDNNKPTDNPKDTTTVMDIDSNVYHTVTIGSQVWMRENLKVAHYRNGSPIRHVTDGWDWWHLADTGAYCNYDNNPANGNIYGHMYNWHAINTGLLCPQGWHVPTEAEWATLANFLVDTVGGKLKETGTTHWVSPNDYANNVTQFTGLPGGYRSSTGSFFSIGYQGHWWTATTGSDPAYARYRFLDFNLGGLYGNEDYKIDGLSVRCIKD